jgi:hypothetical protein
MTSSKERGVPGEGTTPRRTLETDDENERGVDSNHNANLTVDGKDWKQQNCGQNLKRQGCRPERPRHPAMGGVL